MARRKSVGSSNGAAAAATATTTTTPPQTKENSEEHGVASSSPVKRYKESRRRIAQQSGGSGGTQTGSIAGPGGLFVSPEDVDGLQDEQANVEGLDEPTLGQRLRGIRAQAAAGDEDDDDDDDDEDDEEEDEEDEDEDEDENGLLGGNRGAIRAAPLAAGSLSLGETLSQALHSDDQALLSSCLAHYDSTVIRLSVSRLSGPLALRLLEKCVERMAHGGRRSAGQLDSARARGIIEWIRATLTAHTAYLMSVPTLVHRLAQLHATLTARLASQDRLLALNGRLELVLSQIELRNAYASEQRVRVQGVKTKALAQRGIESKKGKRRSEGEREWVETSSDEDENERMDVDDSDEEDSADDDDDDDDDDEEEDADGVEVRRAEEDGGIEDVALGQNVRRGTAYEESDEEEKEEDLDEEAEEEDQEEDEDEDEDEEESDSNALLDLEAESTDGEGEDDEDESEDDE